MDDDPSARPLALPFLDGAIVLLALVLVPTTVAGLVSEWLPAGARDAEAYRAVAGGLAQVATAAAACLVLARRRGGPRALARSLGLVRTSERALGRGAVLGVSLLLPLAIVSAALERLAPLPSGYGAELRRVFVDASPLATVLATLTVVQAAPMAEELVFRGLLLRGLHPKVGATFALLLSSVLFGVVHQHPLLVVHATLAGLALGALVGTRGSLYPAMVAHAVYNQLQVFCVRSRVDPAELPVALGPATTAGLFGLSVVVGALVLREARREARASVR